MEGIIAHPCIQPRGLETVSSPGLVLRQVTEQFDHLALVRRVNPP